MHTRLSGKEGGEGRTWLVWSSLCCLDDEDGFGDAGCDDETAGEEDTED